MSDDALRSLLANQQKTRAPRTKSHKETPVSKIAKYFKLHPKVKAALLAVAVVAYTAFDDAYNSGASYQDAIKITAGAVVVWLFAYAKSSA
jgi:hypothetical protein